MKKLLKKWSDSNNTPPSNRLQKISIYTSVLLTAVATVISLITFNQSQRIEGMEDVLRSFKSDVRFVPGVIAKQKNGLNVSGRMKNFGTRAAYNIQMEFYFLTPKHVFWEEAKNGGIELAAGDDIHYSNLIDRPDIKNLQDFSYCHMVTKINFIDVVTSQNDSTYLFLTTNKVINDSVIIFRAAIDKEIEVIQKEIRAKRSTF
jgi:hypothetical protein